MSGAPLGVAIVGTGFSGLCMAIRLKMQGRSDFTLFEQAGDIGGTWRENHYPGCACDVPSHLYSFSFELSPNWSRAFAPQPEIHAYLKHCVAKYELSSHIRLRTQVTSARFDDARGLWELTLNGSEQLWARHVVFGIGALSRPAMPKIPGLERFKGPAFHSAQWRHDVELSGKRIAVIGTGASAIQFVPQIQKQAAHIDLFQRTPPWILPKPDVAIPEGIKRLFALSPALLRLARWLIYFVMELRGLGFTVDPRVMTLGARLGRRHIANSIADPELRAKVTPNYTPGCKRILISSDYYPALAQPNVSVITTGIREVTARGVVTEDGVEHEADALVFGTGFDVAELLGRTEVWGRGGLNLREAWKGGAEAYMGTSVAGFPNFSMLMGPNTGLGHNSMVFMIESQVNHVLGCMAEAERQRASLSEVKEEALRRFNGVLQPRLRRSVWASGCQSWYLDASGRNATLWPGFTFEFWWKSLRLQRDDYAFRATPEVQP